MEQKKDHLLYEILSRLFLALLFNLFGSVMPQWSSLIFKVNLALIFLGIIVSIVIYRKVSGTRTMWNQVSSVLMLLLGFFMVTPFLRLTLGTMIFWILLAAYVIYIINFILRYLDVLHGVQLPGLTGYRHAMIWLTFILFIGTFFLVNENGNILMQIVEKGAPPLVFIIIFYIGGLFFTLGAFILLIDN